MKRSQPLKPGPGPTRKTPLRSKRNRLTPGQQDSYAAVRARGRCELATPVCDGRHPEVHHRKMRSAGGDEDPAFLALACRACHRYVHAHPAASRAAGWLLSRYPGDE